LAAACCTTWAQQTVRIFVPFAAGSSTDTIARQLADSLREVNGNLYVVENRPGAAGIIGSTEVNKAKPDGSVLLMTTGGHATNAVLYQKLPYDAVSGFTPISQLTASSGFLLMVPATSPYKTLEQLVAAAKTRPGLISYGSAGNGNTTHLAGALFERAAGVKIVHIPYRGAPTNDLYGGHLDMIFWGASFGKLGVKDGKARALAITGDTRLPDLPDVPTLNEKGIRGVDVPAWTGMFGPPGMTPELASKIQQDVALAMQRPGMVNLLNTLGSVALASTPAQFSDSLSKDIAKLRRDVGPLGIRMD